MCLNPITIKVDNIQGVRSLQVPCGKCAECLKRKQNEWLVRLYYQFRESPKACFFTLTYNQDSVPTVYDEDTGECWLSVCKRHLQNAFKSFRRDLDKQYDVHERPVFKYFITSEYGPRTSRPHYHGIIFGLDHCDLWPFFKRWERKYGFFSWSDIAVSEKQRQCSARYVSKYCTKGIFENPLVKMGLVEPTFHLISKGIGLCYVTKLSRDYHLAKDSIFYQSRFSGKCRYSSDYLDAVISRLVCHLPDSSDSKKSFPYRMPRYYKDKLFSIQKVSEESACSQVPMLFLKTQLANRVLKVSDDRYLEQCRAFSDEWHVPLHEAVSALALQDTEAARLRDSEIKAALCSFFYKSAF